MMLVKISSCYRIRKKNYIISNIFSVAKHYKYEDISVPNHSFENILRKKSKELENVCVKWQRSDSV
jgi:ribosomal protein L25 (general stress protein Ctc)